MLSLREEEEQCLWVDGVFSLETVSWGPLQFHGLQTQSETCEDPQQREGQAKFVTVRELETSWKPNSQGRNEVVILQPTQTNANAQGAQNQI